MSETPEVKRVFEFPYIKYANEKSFAHKNDKNIYENNIK